MSELDFRKQRHVEINRNEANDHPGATFVHGIMQKAGETLCPQGMRWEASATVHLYFKPDEFGIGRSDFAFICSLRGFEKIPEHQADAAFKTLMAELMRQYGRKIPEFRKS